MARPKTDWSVLRGTLVVFGVVTLLAAALVAGSVMFRGAAQRDFKAAQSSFMGISRRYLTLDDEERVIRAHYPRFVELYNAGVIGRENRLAWLETLRTSGERLAVPELRYNIKAREEFDPDFRVSTGRFRLYATRMELEMGLLHEGDFLGVMDALAREAPGLHTVSKCVLERLENADDTLQADRANLSAKCDLHWLTVNLPGGKEIAL